MASQLDFARNAAFHDGVAPEYDEHLLRNAHNVRAREAFCKLALENVPRGATIFDFGCGTGIDAQTYAQSGYRVFAYDNSPGMVAQLKVRCAPAIAAGEVVAWSEAYPSFLSHFPESCAPAAITANFAVLNSIPDLAPLFATFARNLVAPGLVIVSVLNPLHWAKLRSPGWWLKGFGKRDRAPIYDTQPYPTYMHYVSQVLRAAPQFHLVGRANSGRFVRYDAADGSGRPRFMQDSSGSQGGALDRFAWTTPAYRFLGHFLFLILRKNGC
jgi:SAM-dependent methyltransferase